MSRAKGADLIDEVASGSGGGNHSVAHSKVGQEVHCLLMLGSFSLLQRAQELRVVSDGMRRVEVWWCILAVQLAVDAAPDEAHDVLGQGACTASHTPQFKSGATCSLPLHFLITLLDNISNLTGSQLPVYQVSTRCA